MKKQLLIALAGLGLIGAHQNALGLGNLAKGAEALTKLNAIINVLPALVISIADAQVAQQALNPEMFKQGTIEQRLDALTKFIGVVEKWTAVLNNVKTMIPKDDVKAKAAAAIDKLQSVTNDMTENIGGMRLLIQMMQQQPAAAETTEVAEVTEAI